MSLSPLFKSAFDALSNFIIVDDQCKIAYINQKYAKLLGISIEDAIGQPVEEIVSNTDLPNTIKTGKPKIGAVMTFFDHSTKQNIKLVCNRIPLFENHKVIGAAAITTFNEVTEVYNLYEELETMREQNKLYQETLKQLKKHKNPLNNIIGVSSEIITIKKTISDFAKSNLTVLLTGETGVGKEVFANALHELSNRSLNNFVRINCAAIPKDLLESELFGYEGGAFTGALKHGKIGKFELADEGTLLLDEIGEMPLSLQAKLLRVLQEKEVERIGGLTSKKINVRVICSTNQDLPQLIKEGKFRTDLYYRINTVELHIPPLRERIADIPDLCQFFIKKINQESGTHTLGIKPEVISLLQKYHWPGNVRELEHIIERLAFLHQNSYISLKNCDFIKDKINPDTSNQPSFSSLQYQRNETEKEAILNALAQTGGNKSKAAKLLGIDRSMLYYKLKKYKL